MWNSALKYDLIEIGFEQESAELQVKETNIEILRILHKLFLLTDLSGRIQVNHFSDLSKQMGNDSLWSHFFKPKIVANLQVNDYSDFPLFKK